MLWKHGVALIFCIAVASPLAAKPTHGPYLVEVWADVLFDSSGEGASYQIAGERDLPAAFVQQVKLRLDKARIEPRLVSGKPVSFKTGVRMSFEVTPGPGGGTVRVTRVDMAPRPIKTSVAQIPRDIARVAEWSGTLKATCHVSTEGICSKTELSANAGIPESARRWAAASFKSWTFMPQELDGAKVPGEYGVILSLEIDGPRLEDFRQDKFDRLMWTK